MRCLDVVHKSVMGAYGFEVLATSVPAPKQAPSENGQDPLADDALVALYLALESVRPAAPIPETCSLTHNCYGKAARC